MVNTSDYYENEAISQSQLKLLLSGSPRLFNTVREPELYFEEKKHFVIGSAVDCLLTQPIEEFDRLYYVTSLENKPTDVMMSIINQVFDRIKEEHPLAPIYDITHPDYINKIVESIHEHDYRRTWSDEVRWAKVCENYEYWDELRNSQGKVILSTEENNIITQIVISLRTSEATGKYFAQENGKEIMFQVPIYWDYEGVSVKALLDMVVINHHDKTIQPIDIKTVGDYSINFPKSVRQRRYDIQASFYTEACKILKNNLNLWDYKIMPFKFLVESTIEPGTPLVFTCTSKLLYIGKFGNEEVRYENNILVQEIKGFHDLIQLYKYYQENGFETDHRVRESNSEFVIDWFGIV